LRTRPVRGLHASFEGSDVVVTTAHLDRVDVFVDGRPLGSLDVIDDSCRFAVEPMPPPGTGLDLAGYDEGSLVAARRYAL